MIKENQKLFNRLNVITDAVAAFVSIAAAYLLVFNLLDFERNFPLADYFKLLLIFVPVQLVTYGCMGLYDSFRSKSFSTELGRLTAALLLDGLALIALLYVVQIINFSRWTLAIFLMLDFLIVAIKRFILRKTLRKFRESGYNRKYVLIVGSGTAARDYLRTIREERQLGFECAGYVSDGELPSAKHMGGYNNLLKVLEERSYDEVVCALDADDSDRLSSVVEACELTGTKISVIPTIYKYMSSSPAIDVIGNIPVMNIRRIPLDNIGNAMLKRTVDIIGSLVLLILTSPLTLVSMIVIKLTMGGNVIFRQKRVGLNKKVFTMYKLKSMRDSTESDTAWSTDTDPRRTKFGSFIRKFSIDELPQLVNVLKGDMSLVGPRPEIPFYVNDFKNKIPMYMIKHQVKPGITGLAQINGYRGDTSIEKRIEYDVQYIENWSFFLDISILLKTAFSGFMNKEKLSPSASGRKAKTKSYKAEKYNMNNKGKTDIIALAMFLPSVIVLALVPVIIHIQSVITDLKETYMFHGGTPIEDSSGTAYELFDSYSQGKALAVIVLALIMIGMALVCCLSLFRRIEKRSFIYVGCSAVFVIMSLASAINSQYSSIAFSGEYDRAEGFYTTACYFVLFLFTMYAFRTSGNFKFVAIALFICVGVNFVLGIFQATGHNLLNQEWFMNIVTDSSLRGEKLNVDITTTSMYGALYNSNYVGSFSGMIVPLFTVMAIYSEKALWRVLYILFDLMAVIFLVGSLARSGIVALAAALVVGIIIFAKQIAKHWKRCAIIAVAAAVVIVGANFALGNRLFARIPSLVQDAVGLFLPSDEQEKDLYSQIPLRDISAQPDGSMLFTGQDDTMTMIYNADVKDYTYTNSAGEPIGTTSAITFDAAEYTSLTVNADYSAGTVNITAGEIYAKLLIDGGSGMMYLDSNSPYNLVSSDSGRKLDINALGIAELTLGEHVMSIEYDNEYKRLLFTEADGREIRQNEIISFSDDTFKDVHLWMMDADGSSLTRDIFAMYFYNENLSCLFFNLKNEKKLEVINYRSADEFNPVNAEYIGFEGKEKIGSSRGYIWSRTLPLLKNCLITGYGPDTYTYIFPQNDYLAKYYSYQDFGEGFYITVDKPHNLYLQIFYGNGLIALIAFLGIVVFYLVDCFRLYALRKEYRAEQIMGIAVMLGIVGYLAAGIFNDSVVHVAPVFWVLLGTGAALNTINRRADRNIAVDEDYVPVKKQPAPTPEQSEADRQDAAAAQELAALIRNQADNPPQKKRESRQYTKDDISNLLESVRAMRAANSEHNSPESQPENSDKNKENSEDGSDDNS